MDEQLAELQQKMVDNSCDNALVDELGLQVDELRENRQDILAEAAERTDLQARMNDMITFLEEMPAAITDSKPGADFSSQFRVIFSAVLLAMPQVRK